MSGFDSLLDQERPVRLIKTAIRRGRLPHAFLFTGIEGIGKKTAAMAFAMANNCRNLQRDGLVSDGKNQDFRTTGAGSVRPCGECPACKKIASGNHPDIHTIKPAGNIIKIDQVRALCKKLALKPYEARLRVALIADAHLLNKESGNTLLKILEEPPDRTVFILTALQASEVLPTILSRCRHIRFSPISRKSLQARLVKAYGSEPAEAAALAAMSGGSITRAELMTESGWLKKRDWIIEQLESFSSTSIGCCLAFAEALSREKQLLPAAFETMKNWFRDLIVYRYAPDNIINRDLAEKISIASKRTTVEVLLYKIKIIEKAEYDIRANANPRLTLDALCVMLLKERLQNGKNHRCTV